MGVLDFLAETGARPQAWPPRARSDLARAASMLDLPAAATLVAQGGPSHDEYLLVRGRAVSLIRDADGRESVVGLHRGPSPLPPNISRTARGVSLTAIETLSPATLFRIAAPDLMDLMVTHADIRDWGNAAMRDELVRRSEREWGLAALRGADRLRWFRQGHAGDEDRFPHGLIASFLGMTPVTFSRLRNTK